MYECNHFRLIAVSQQHQEEITALACDNKFIYSSCGSQVFAWRTTSEHRHVYRSSNDDDKIRHLLPFGQHLIAIGDANVLRIWEIESEEVYLEIPFDRNQFAVSAIMHPFTYLNKILLGSEQGGLQLWNIKDGKLIHTFTGYDSRISVLEQAPASDVVGVGLQSGGIKLLNLKFDEIVMEFSQDWGPVTGISFRTDGRPIMCTSSTNGSLVFWNLEDRKVASQLQSAHLASVTTLKCLASEPLLITTSPDNSLRMWIFDMPDEGARLIRYREGHSAPPTCIRYHGQKGLHLLSAGEDSSLRIFHTISEKFNRSLGRASYNKKASKKKGRHEVDHHLMPSITEFTTELTREKEWDNIAAIHTGLHMVTSWSFDKCKMGELKLLPPREPGTTEYLEATCITLTSCGNFVVIGYSNGQVERFNIQSGVHRGSYGKPKAHKTAIRGVACDALNQIVCSVSSNGWIKFWFFKSKADTPAIYQEKLSDGLVLLRNHRESGMIAVALENYEVVVLDCDTRTTVRRFKGHRAPITDLCFSPDSRWLITASMDATIKVWDIPSAYLIDHFKMETPCISLSMSPCGDFLATAHIDHLGVFLWSNKTLFDHITLRSIDPESEPPTLELVSFCHEADAKEEEENSDDELGEIIYKEYASPEQLEKGLLTMSDSVASRWQTLLNLDVIKRRNRPKVPIKKEKHTPFFLPTVAGLELKFDLPGAEDGRLESKVIIPENFDNFSVFGNALVKCQGGFEEVIEAFMKMGPSMVDFEIKSMGVEVAGSIRLLDQFMKMLMDMLESNRNFELVQTYLAVFLREHGPEVVKHQVLRSHLSVIQSLNEQGWKRLEEKLMYGLGVVGALRNFVK